jgi:hypothetical protein
MKSESLARVVGILACLAAGACGGSSPPTTPTTLTTTPNQPTTSAPVLILITGVGCSNQNGCFTGNFVVGASAQFTATAEFPGGTRQDITSEATWESTDTAIVTVTRSGQVTGAGAGYVQVRAAYNGVTGSVYLQVAARSPGAAACGFDGATGPQTTDWQAKTSGVLLVLTGAGCSWTATTDASWITLTGPVSGAGTIGGTESAQVSYSVAEYQYSTAAPRVGHITVRSASGVLRTSDITQWANCTGPTPKEQAVSFTADGGQSARFDVLLGYPAVCKWRIISDADWITISGASTTVLQMGDGDFHIDASPNPGSSPRTAKVYADGTVYAVTQAGR